MNGPIQNLTVDIGVEISLWVIVNGTPPGGAPRDWIHTNMYRCPPHGLDIQIDIYCIYVLTKSDKEKTMIGPQQLGHEIMTGP